MHLMSRLDRATTAAPTYADRGLDGLDGSRADGVPPKTMARELRLSMALLTMRLIAVAFLARDASRSLGHRIGAGDVRGVAEQSVLLIVMAFLIFGNVVYQLARVGYLRKAVRPPPRGRRRPDRLRYREPPQRGHPGAPLPGGAPRGGPEPLMSAALRYPSRVGLLILLFYPFEKTLSSA